MTRNTIARRLFTSRADSKTIITMNMNVVQLNKYSAWQSAVHHIKSCTIRPLNNNLIIVCDVYSLESKWHIISQCNGYILTLHSKCFLQLETKKYFIKLRERKKSEFLWRFLSTGFIVYKYQNAMWPPRSVRWFDSRCKCYGYSEIYKRMIRVTVGVARQRTLTAQWSWVPSVGQNLKPVTFL